MNDAYKKVLFTSTSIVRFSSIIAQSVIPLYAYSIKLPAYNISILIAILWIFNGIGSLLVSLIKKIDYFIVISFSFTILGFLLLIFSKNFYYLSISMILIGLGLGSVSIILAPSMHLTNNGFEGIALYSFALSIGLILGTLFSSIILSYLSFKYVFLIVIGFIIITIITTIKFKYKSPNMKISFNINDLSLFAKNRKFLRYFIINFVYSFILPMIISYWGIYEESRLNIKANMVMLSLFLMFIASSLLRFRFIKIDQKTLDKIEPISIFIIPLVFFLLNINNTILSIIALVLFAIPHSSLYPIFLYKAYTSIDQDKILSGNMIFSISSGLAEFLSPLLALLIISHFTINKLFLLTSPIAFLIVLIYLLLN